GKLYAVPVHPDGSPGAIRQLWESHPFDAPDGLAVAQSGHIYIALVGPSNQLVELAAAGTEIARYPSAPVTGDNGSAIPFDDPSSVKFLGTSILVANQSYITGNPQHWAILQVDVGETGLPEYVPPGAGVPPNAPPAGAVEAVSA